MGNELAVASEFWAAVYRRERSDGRIQSRLTIEVPWELEPAEVRQLVAGFMRRFDELELPYYAVVHRPGAGSDRRNVHLHMVYHDRSAALDGGAWTFARTKRPEPRAASWIFGLRRRWAGCVNHALEMASQHRVESGKPAIMKRYDPRPYHEVGVVKLPTLHLGPRWAARERDGRSTLVGAMNAKRELWWQVVELPLQRWEAARERLMKTVAGPHDVADHAGARKPAPQRQEALEAAYADLAEKLEHGLPEIVVAELLQTCGMPPLFEVEPLRQDLAAAERAFGEALAALELGAVHEPQAGKGEGVPARRELARQIAFGLVGWSFAPEPSGTPAYRVDAVADEALAVLDVAAAPQPVQVPDQVWASDWLARRAAELGLDVAAFTALLSESDSDAVAAAGRQMQALLDVARLNEWTPQATPMPDRRYALSQVRERLALRWPQEKEWGDDVAEDRADAALGALSEIARGLTVDRAASPGEGPATWRDAIAEAMAGADIRRAAFVKAVVEEIPDLRLRGLHGLGVYGVRLEGGSEGQVQDALRTALGRCRSPVSVEVGEEGGLDRAVIVVMEQEDADALEVALTDCPVRVSRGVAGRDGDWFVWPDGIETTPLDGGVRRDLDPAVAQVLGVRQAGGPLRRLSLPPVEREGGGWRWRLGEGVYQFGSLGRSGFGSGSVRIAKGGQVVLLSSADADRLAALFEAHRAEKREGIRLMPLETAIRSVLGAEAARVVASSVRELSDSDLLPVCAAAREMIGELSATDAPLVRVAEEFLAGHRLWLEAPQPSSAGWRRRMSRLWQGFARHRPRAALAVADQAEGPPEAVFGPPPAAFAVFRRNRGRHRGRGGPEEAARRGRCPDAHRRARPCGAGNRSSPQHRPAS